STRPPRTTAADREVAMMMRRKNMTKATLSLLVSVGLAVPLAVLVPGGIAQAATVTVDLYAVSGSVTLPGQTVPTWGYSTNGDPVTQPGGPTIYANEGDTLQVTLHNGLSSEDTGLLFQGQDMVPDLTGTGPGSDKLYTFTASRAGTYLYEAGLLPNAEHQVAMGLYGALVVRPAAAGQAYDDPATSFNDEAVLVLSEIDPALNNAVDPTLFDMRKYAPRYFLINGKAYPDTDEIATTGGNKVLLRYVNAGQQYHSMAVLGAHQSVIALDGSPLDFSRQYVAETFGPGQTADAIVTAPDAKVQDHRLAVQDGSQLMHNSSAAGAGGMLTFITIPGTGDPTDTVGPVSKNAVYELGAPGGPGEPSAPGVLTATVDDSNTGNANVQTAEYFIDTVGDPGTGTPMQGAFGSPTENVTATDVPVPGGNHVLYVRGQDENGNWGVFSSVLANGGDIQGPTTNSAKLVRNPTNGAFNVAVSATGDDTATGGSDIAAAEYFIDADPGAGSGAAMTVNLPATIASLDAVIPAATVNALPEGTHVVSIRSQDSAGVWGDPVTIDLLLDKTGPDTTDVTAAPDPNNGKIPFNASVDAVRVTATLTDPLSGGVSSGIRKGEVFIDSVGANGKGIPLDASDGAFDSSVELGHLDIPLATIRQLSDGVHTIYVHGKDAARSWGATSSTTLLIDKTGPAVSAVVATPNPTAGAANVNLTATANDALSTVAAAEYFVGKDPGAGNGTAMSVAGSNLSATIDVSGWAAGEYKVKVRARDSVGNWGPRTTTVLVVS
ncbi:MAG TPA: multicopper oxidase family protein, partial [Actinomycetes bacterium]|nr:multicopper oxidase family protein [Actinomycetes bacterium]